VPEEVGFSLHEKDGKPLDANAIFTIPRTATQTLAALGQHLRQKHGSNLKEFLNETHR
jgi:hypothetical protein